MNSTCELGRHGASALKPYPAYRDSGVEWLGEIPAHWEVRRLGRLGRLFKGGGGTKEDEREDGIPCVRYGDLYTHHRSFITESRACVTPELAATTYTPIRYGDILFAGSGETIDEIGKSAVNLIRGAACCGGDVIIFRPSIDADARFLGYVTDCSPSARQKACVGRGFTVMHIYSSDLKYMTIAIPPLPEQAAIVRFLDYIDRRIQRYVRAKEKLIALLEEQKKAIIHEAVTGQIDVRTGRPYPTYMDSGVEWLGEVPSHWEVKRIGRFSKVGNGSTPSRGNPAYWSNGDHPWLNSSSVNKGTIAAADQFVTVRALRECHLPRVPANSVLVGITGQGKTRGMAALLTIDATINQHMAYITPNIGTISPRYLYMCLAAAYAELRGLSSASGSTKEALTCEDIKTFRLVLPPINEQEVLLSAVARRLRSLERCARDARRQIDLVQEYRDRLITDGVTGKLDLREESAGLSEVNPRVSEGDTDGGVDQGVGPVESDWRHTVEEGSASAVVADAERSETWAAGVVPDVSRRPEAKQEMQSDEVT